MTLKIATTEDKELVLNLCMSFINSIWCGKYAHPYSIEGLVDAFLSNTNGDKLVLLNGDKGFLAAQIAPFMFGTEPVANEVAWYVLPEHRESNVGGELLEAFEFWAKKQNCKFITLSCLDESVARFYESRDYKLLERAYVKEI